MAWSQADIPELPGQFAVVTGASGGLGAETARGLAAHGAEVVVAARDRAKAEAVVAGLASPARFEPVDLGDLGSIEAFAARMLEAGRPIDILINNAGVMGPPNRRTTKDGFELQFGVNHFGHFALTGRLLPLLRRAPAPRVVTVASLAARMGRLDFDDLQAERRYSALRQYGASKLANYLFAQELQRRSEANGWGLTSLAAHPGWARTELMEPRQGMARNTMFAPSKLVEPLLSQSATDGAGPTLLAATSPDVRPGGYYGPTGALEMKGPPAVDQQAAKPSRTKDADAARLWDVSERLTGVVYG